MFSPCLDQMLKFDSTIDIIPYIYTSNNLKHINTMKTFNETTFEAYAAAKALINEAEGRGIDTGVKWSLQRFFESSLQEFGKEKTINLLTALVAEGMGEAVGSLKGEGKEVKE